MKRPGQIDVCMLPPGEVDKLMEQIFIRADETGGQPAEWLYVFGFPVYWLWDGTS